MVAYAALFVALGGTSYAARDLITGKDIKRGAVTSKHVKNGSLKKGDFRKGQLPAGRQGARGPRGATGATGARGARGLTGAPGSARGFAWINPGNSHLPQDTPVRPRFSKGVNAVVQPDLPGAGPNWKFCFDLTFAPLVGVGSSTTANNGNVTARLPSDISPAQAFTGEVSDTDCPEGFRDAVVGTYAANTSAPLDDILFSVIFE